MPSATATLTEKLRCSCDINRDWDRALLLQRIGLTLGLTLLAGWGLKQLALLPLMLVLFPLLVWPYSYVVEIEGATLCVRWLFLSRRLPLSTIRGIELLPDARLGYIGARPLTLKINFSTSRPLVVRAAEVTLRELESALRVVT